MAPGHSPMAWDKSARQAPASGWGPSPRYRSWVWGAGSRIVREQQQTRQGIHPIKPQIMSLHTRPRPMGCRRTTERLKGEQNQTSTEHKKWSDKPRGARAVADPALAVKSGHPVFKKAHKRARKDTGSDVTTFRKIRARRPKATNPTCHKKKMGGGERGPMPLQQSRHPWNTSFSRGGSRNG